MTNKDQVMFDDFTAKRLSPKWWEHSWFVQVNLTEAIKRVMTSNAQPQAGQVVVDIGCGRMPYKPLFQERGCKYIGCDIRGDVDVLVHPGQPIALPDNSADGVVSFQVLEHVWDIEWYLTECYRILKPGGWLELSTHGTWLYHPAPTDFRRWTKDGLVAELEQRGFKVAVLEPVMGPLAWTTLFRLIGFREVLRKIPLLGPMILLPLVCLMNLRMVLEDWITPAWMITSHAAIYVTLSRK
jgi:SAM-dependent methyltransferase